jgi:hypothetical protein
MSSISSNWTRVCRVPNNFLKKIGFGALKGKSDISPQWRIKAMTEVYGMCGEGWYHECKSRWTERCDNGEMLVFCEVNVFTRDDGGEWSKPVVGFGGNKIIELAKGSPKPSDEGWKMAYTDALGTALKSIGVASEIYEGNFDGSKYASAVNATPQLPTEAEVRHWIGDNGKTKDEVLNYVAGLGCDITTEFTDMVEAI